MEINELMGPAAFVIMILKLVFDFLKSRHSGLKVASQVDLPRLYAMVRDLHEWHDVRDVDGTPIWYVKRSLEVSIEKLATNIDIQTRMFERLLARMG